MNVTTPSVFLTYSSFDLTKTMIIFAIIKYIFRKQSVFTRKQKTDNTHFRNRSCSLADFPLSPHNNAKFIIIYKVNERRLCEITER